MGREEPVPEIRHAYSRRIRPQIDASPEANRKAFPQNKVHQAVQSDRDSCDINRLMARYENDGVMPLGREGGQFLDVSSVGSYPEVIQRLKDAEEFFALQPAKIRAAFDNDVAKFLEVASNPEAHLELLEQLGLILPAESPAAVRPVTPPAGDEPA